MSNDVLKILHLTSSINGGAGLAALKIHNLFKDNGLNSELLIGESISKSKLSIKFKLFIKQLLKSFIPKSLLLKRKDIKRNSYESAYCFYQRKERFKNGLNRKTADSIEHVDFLFVYWVSDFFNSYDIEYIKSKHNCKVIFVMLDHVHISGGYHFLLDEYNQYLEKNNLKISKPNEALYNHQLTLKKEIYNKISSEILAFSEKDLLMAKDCPLNFKKYWKTALPIDDKYFFPLPNTNIENDTKTIFCCSYDFSDFRKGAGIFKKILKILDGMLKSNQKIKVLCSDDVVLKNLNLKNVIFDYFEYSSDPEIYSSIYHKSDLFIFTSIADSAPQMPSEALYCGVPVISFNIGNIREIIIDTNDGYIVNNFDADEMANKIYELLYETNGINSESNKLKRFVKIKKYHDKDKIMNTFRKIIGKEL